MIETNPINTAQSKMFPMVEVPEEQQKAIVEYCNKFKQASIDAAKTKKYNMQQCVAYFKNQFIEGDGLPRMSINSPNDAKTDRKRTFYPLTRRQIKTIYAQLKLLFFPTDENYMRFKGKTPEAAEYEDLLTEAFEQILQNMQFTEKFGKCLLDAAIFGVGVPLPSINDAKQWSWQYNEVTQKYEAFAEDTAPLLALDALNPLYFFVDPTAKDKTCSAWGNYYIKSLQEIKDSNLYFNKEKAEAYKDKGTTLSNYQKDLLKTNSYFGLDDVQGAIDNVEYDYYYFPYLPVGKGYRNMIVGVVGESVLVRFHPNMSPKGYNPCSFFTWMDDIDSPYGTGVAEDLLGYQKLINQLYDYLLDTMAKIGNKFVVSPETDMSAFFGEAGGIAVSDNPSNDVVPVTGNYIEVSQLQNIMGVANAEAQILTGSQSPFQGSSNVDFKKTATELQINQEQGASITREIVEHIATTGLKPTLKYLAYLAADLYKDPIIVRRSENGKTVFEEISLSVLKSNDYEIEITSVNASQSKAAQVNSLMQLLQFASTNPQGLMLADDVIRKIGQLNGIKDVDTFINKMQEKLQQQMGAMNAPVV